MINPPSRFLKHEPCPKCHSRDNLGRWDDGHAHCFGCGYYEPSERTIQNHIQSSELVSGKSDERVFYTERIPDEPHRWLKKYGITDGEIRTFGIRYCPATDHLAFGVECSEDSECTFLTKRYFGSNPNSSRYVSSRTKPFVVFDQTDEREGISQCERIEQEQLWQQDRTRSSLIFVEDIISAIKVSRVCSSSPVFSSTVGVKRLKTASKLFKRLGIWLDRDMYPKAVLEAIKGKSLGFPCYGAIRGPRDDPKDHTDGEIYGLVRELFDGKRV